MTKGKRRPKSRTGQPRESVFEERAHRWAVESEPMAYAMACIEVVLEEPTEAAAQVFSDLVRAYDRAVLEWSNKPLRSAIAGKRYEKLVQELLSAVSEAQQNVHKPWSDLAEFAGDPDSWEGLNEDADGRGDTDPSDAEDDAGIAHLLRGFKIECDPVDGKWTVVPNMQREGDVAIAAQFNGVLELVLKFIEVGFNRNSDVAEGRPRVVPSLKAPWLLLGVLYRAAWEHHRLSLEKVGGKYGRVQVGRKTYRVEDLTGNGCPRRLHDKIVASAKGEHLVLHNDQKYSDAARLWKNCRVLHSSIEDYLAGQPWKGKDADYKNVQKKIRPCDDAVGYRRRGLIEATDG